MCGSLQRILKEKLPEKLNVGNWFLNYDNAPTHSALCPNFWLNKMTVISHLPSSPESVPCDFFLVPYLKMRLKEGEFNDITMIQTKLWDALAEFPKKHLRKCFEWWHDHWAHLVLLISSRKTEHWVKLFSRESAFIHLICILSLLLNTINSQHEVHFSTEIILTKNDTKSTLSCQTP